MFEYINCVHTRNMVRNAYEAAERLNLRDFFANINPPDNTGYMFWNDPRLLSFGRELESDGHSGASFAYVCRNLQSYYRDPDAHKNLHKKSKLEN